MVNGLPPHHKHQRRRFFILAFFIALSLIQWVPDLRRTAGHPLGLTGVSFMYNGVVAAVDPKAARSGIRAGDRLDLNRATFDQRQLLGPGEPDAGTTIQAPMLRGNVPYTAHVTTYAESADRIDTIWLRVLVQILSIVLGALMVVRQPSPATSGLFFALFCGCAPVNDVYLLGPAWWKIIEQYMLWILGNNVGRYGAIVFALYLLRPGPLPRWRQFVMVLTVALAGATVIASLWHVSTERFSPHPDVRAWVATSVLFSIPLFVALFVLIATYFESSPNLRERLRWIIAGFLLSAICNAIDQAGSQGNLALFQESYVLHALLVAGLYLFIALPVAYAVLKHHIIDVSVVVSRATVYTTLSVVVIGTFTLVDFFFSRALDQKSAGLIVDVALALVLGFSFNALHHRVDDLVERLLFHKRHLAEEHLRGVADAMQYARSEQHVRSMLATEPARALDLSGSRLLIDLEGQAGTLDTLVSFLESRRGAVRVTNGQWNVKPLVDGVFTPAAAIPIFSHASVTAIAFYGLHQNGFDLDREELALLERLCRGAGAALDRLEAEALRSENAALRLSYDRQRQ
jgi:hypothetical protein